MLRPRREVAWPAPLPLRPRRCSVLDVEGDADLGRLLEVCRIELGGDGNLCLGLQVLLVQDAQNALVVQLDLGEAAVLQPLLVPLQAEQWFTYRQTWFATL